MLKTKPNSTKATLSDTYPCRRTRFKITSDEFSELEACFLISATFSMLNSAVSAKPTSASDNMWCNGCSTHVLSIDLDPQPEYYGNSLQNSCAKEKDQLGYVHKVPTKDVAFVTSQNKSHSDLCFTNNQMFTSWPITTVTSGTNSSFYKSNASAV